MIAISQQPQSSYRENIVYYNNNNNKKMKVIHFLLHYGQATLFLFTIGKIKIQRGN